MSTNKSKISTIVSVNAYSNVYYGLKDQSFKPIKKLSYSNSNYLVSYLSNKDIITTTVEVSRSIDSEDIHDMIETQVYEDLGLDQANEYMIETIEGEPNGDNRVFHAFVVEPQKIKDVFAPTTEETKYIDLIIPAPLMYKPLYTREILHKEDGVHCFIYFTLRDAFVTFYKHGEYLYTKSIEYSLNLIYEKFCEYVGEQVDEREFYKILETEGLKTHHAEYQQNLMRLFGEIFITINDIVIYVKRAHDLTSIDQMYIGTSRGPVLGLDEYSENYLGLKSSELNFNYELQNDEWYVDQFQYLSALSAIYYMEDDLSTVNLTLFRRPPVFYKRTSGQFIISIVSAIMLGISYPLYFLLGSYANDTQNFILQKEENDLVAIAEKYKKILSEKQEIIKGLDEEIKRLTHIHGGKEKTITSIYDKKVHYNLKSELYYNFSKDIADFKVHINEAQSQNDNFTFSLISEDEKEITGLIKLISEKYFNKISLINIDTIIQDENTSNYRGTLKVNLR